MNKNLDPDIIAAVEALVHTLQEKWTRMELPVPDPLPAEFRLWLAQSIAYLVQRDEELTVGRILDELRRRMQVAELHTAEA